MNLLGLLMAAMTTKNALGQIAKKTGLSEKQIKKLMMIAIPILIKYLTKNASSGDGAHSLLGALAQHNNKEDRRILVSSSRTQMRQTATRSSATSSARRRKLSHRISLLSPV